MLGPTDVESTQQFSIGLATGDYRELCTAIHESAILKKPVELRLAEGGRFYNGVRTEDYDGFEQLRRRTSVLMPAVPSPVDTDPLAIRRKRLTGTCGLRTALLAIWGIR